MGGRTVLRLSEAECGALLDVIFDNSITGLALVGEDGTFRRANPSFCRLVEYSEAELRKLRYQDITDPVDVRQDEEMAALVAAGEYETYDYHKSYITKTKRSQPILLRVTGVRINGKFMYFCAEIAPLDSPPAERALEAGIHARAARRRLLAAVRENWHVILTVLGAAAVVAAQVIEKLHPA